MLTEKNKLILTQRVLEILRGNELSHKEIRELFEASMQKDSDTKINGTVEQIISLVIEEQLTILEVVSLVKAVKSTFLLDTCSPLYQIKNKRHYNLPYKTLRLTSKRPFHSF